MIQQALNRLKKCTMEMDMKEIYGTDWDWPQGVALYGLWKVWEYTGDIECFDYVKKWVYDRIDNNPEQIAVNGVAPMIVVSHLYKLTKDERLKPLCDRYIHWIFNEAPRLDCGALEHTVLQDFKFPQQAWIDTTFMCGTFLINMWEATGDTRLRDEALWQLRIHHRILKHKQTGLLCHGYNEIAGICPGNVCWGRGNGWISVASVDILEKTGLGTDDAHYVHTMLKEQFEALYHYFDPNTHMWNTIIDGNLAGNYPESSGTACFAYAMQKGAKLGIVDEKYYEMGKKAGLKMAELVDETGKLCEVSDGTGLESDPVIYISRPKNGLMPWGQGIGLALLGYTLTEKTIS